MLWIVLPAAAAFCAGALHSIDLPGIYMDSVNPDYLVVPILNPKVAPITEWMLPGTLLFDRYPVIVQIYHGALPLYVGLPVYALFGTGVVGIRVTNMVFGLLVIVGTGAVLAAFRIRPLLACFCLTLLALDPAFLFSFRTQFYITLLSGVPLLLSVALVQSRGGSISLRSVTLAGFLAGLSSYGYFIYDFFMPAAALHAWSLWRRDPEAVRRAGFWVFGFVLGISPTLFGYLLIMHAVGGWPRFVNLIANNVNGLQVGNSTATLSQRALYFIDMVRWTLLDVGPTKMMFQIYILPCAAWLKMALLVGLPGVAMAIALLRRAICDRRVPIFPGLGLIAGFVIGFFVMVIAFGSRLWLQHAVFLMPVLYLALAFALEFLVGLIPRYSNITTAASALVLVPFALTSFIDRQTIFQQLRQSGGVGLSSDAISHFAEASMRVPDRIHMFFPDWGLFMPFVMLTRGSFPYTVAPTFDPAEAHRDLCRGEDAVVAIFATQPQNRLENWTKSIGWTPPVVTNYDQRNGVPALIEARWHAADRPVGACD
jgi:hypothetical protein